jgi:glycosyltransferase involved in cell wall biosynthesis
MLRWALRKYVRAPLRPSDYEGADRRVFIMLVSAWGMGGTIRSVHNLAGHLAPDYEVEILSVFRRREKPFFEFPPGVEVTALDDQRPGATPRPLRLPRAILRMFPSALMHPEDRAAKESNLWVDLMLVRKLRRRSGLLIGTRPGLNFIAADLSPPGLITIGEEQMHLQAHSRPLRTAMRRLYPRLDALVALTDEDVRAYQKLLSRRSGAERLRVARIPNTVREIGSSKADLGARTVLAAGRLTPQKGFDLLTKAYARVASGHPDWRLRICGAGVRGENLRRLVEEHGLAEAIELPGPCDLEEEMARASIFVLSSRYEGFPLVLLEAMSKGMAVVSFDCPTGPAEVIDDHENGILVPVGDVEGLASGISELMDDEDLRRRCAAAAVETAGSYTMEAVGPQWEALFAELVQARMPLPVGHEALEAGR